MSLTIGIVAKNADVENEAALRDALRETAGEFGWDIQFGIEAATEQVRGGIESILKEVGPSLLGIIYGADQNDVGEAWYIDTRDHSPERDISLKFFHDTVKCLDRYANSYAVFLSSEAWDPDMQVRCEAFSSEQFLRYLARPQGWHDQYLKLGGGVGIYDDDGPYLFFIRPTLTETKRQ